MHSILKCHARIKYCQWKYQEWKEEESISKEWIEYLFCKKRNGNPSRWKQYVISFSTQNQHCTFRGITLIMVIIMDSISCILKVRSANHHNAELRSTTVDRLRQFVSETSWLRFLNFLPRHLMPVELLH